MDIKRPGLRLRHPALNRSKSERIQNYHRIVEACRAINRIMNRPQNEGLTIQPNRAKLKLLTPQNESNSPTISSELSRPNLRLDLGTRMIRAGDRSFICDECKGVGCSLCEDEIGGSDG